MNNFSNIGPNGYNIGSAIQGAVGGMFGGGNFLTGLSPSSGLYAKSGFNGMLPIGINNSYLFANAGGNFQKKNNSQANFATQYGVGTNLGNVNLQYSNNGLNASTNLGGILGVNYTDVDRAKDLEVSALSPIGKFSVNKTSGLQDIIKGTYESGISPTVGAKLIASVEKEKGQALKYMTEISLAPFEHTTLSTQLYGQGKNTGIGINFGYNRTF